MKRASRPSIAMLPPIRLPIRLPTVERLSDTSEPLFMIGEVSERLSALHPADIVEHSACHLVCRLRARGDGAVFAGRGVAGAVAKRENARINRRLERVGDEDFDSANWSPARDLRGSPPFTPVSRRGQEVGLG